MAVGGEEKTPCGLLQQQLLLLLLLLLLMYLSAFEKAISLSRQARDRHQGC
jgi:hypothetical protein